MIKVRWSNEERAVVNDVVLDHFLKTGEILPLDRAQEVMPQHRRRPVTPSNLWRFGTDVKEFLKKKRATFEPTVEPIQSNVQRAAYVEEIALLEASINPDIPSPGGKRWLQLADAVEAYDTRVEERRIEDETIARDQDALERSIVADKKKGFVGLLTDALDTDEGHALIGVITHAVMRFLDAQRTPAIPPYTPTAELREVAAAEVVPEVERVRLPKVLVVGCLPAQIQVIKGKFKHLYDLRFAQQDSGLRELRGLVPSVQRVVALTSFMSHKTEDVIRANLAEGAQYQRVHGGVSAVLRALE